MHSSYTFTAESAVFDEQNLVSSAGLAPVLQLAEQTGLSRLIDQHLDLPSTRVTSGAVNPVGKLTSIVGTVTLVSVGDLGGFVGWAPQRRRTRATATRLRSSTTACGC
ncbi:MAG: hypothetical protein ABSD32_22790, partial [Mycobacterium sp.]